MNCLRSHRSIVVSPCGFMQYRGGDRKIPGNKSAPLQVSLPMGSALDDDMRRQRFERLALQHLDAAYNLARWLTRDDHDAQDVVQEACLRAMRYFDGFRGEHARPWLLAIVRHTCYAWLKENRSIELHGHRDDADDAALEVAA